MKRFFAFSFLFSLAVLFLYSCQKELSEETNSNNASFSVHDDSTLSCFPIIVGGTYYNGVSANHDTNFIKIVVNVKSTGNYAISSSVSNGFSFSDSGFFSKTGVDTLILKAKGTPILIKSTAFTLSADTLGTCSFFVDVQDSTGTGLGGGTDTTGGGGGIDTTGTGIDSSGSYSANYRDPNPAADNSWHFTDSANKATYSGALPSGSFSSLLGLNIFAAQGVDANNSNLQFSVLVEFPTPTVKTGSYPANGTGSFIDLSNTQTQMSLYSAQGSTAEETADPSYINVTSYDATTKRIKGSFRCWATDSNGKSALIKGSFNTIIQ